LDIAIPAYCLYNEEKGAQNMKGLKTIYICSECGYKTPKWLGKCPSCNQWNTLIEDVISTVEEAPQIKRRSLASLGSDNVAVSYDDLEIPDYIRSVTGLC